MHFIHIEDFFHPDAGYQVNLLSRLQVKQGHSVTIITSELEKMPSYLTTFFGKQNIQERDKAFSHLTGVKIIRIPLLGYYSGRSIYDFKIFKIVDALNPDVLFVHGEDTLIGMQYLWKYKNLNFPLVLDCHMLEMASENRFRLVFRRFYKTFIAPIIIKNKIPLIRVVDSNYVEKCLGIPLNRTKLLSFGTDTDYFSPNEDVSNSFKNKHNINPNTFVILYAGKLDFYKGGQFLADSIKEKFNTSKEVVFLIVGSTDGEYGENVEKTFALSQNRILRFPTQTYLNLAEFYQAADIAIFPKQCSLSFFEVQSCGLPVVFEENEINSSRIDDNGFTFIPEDIKDFRDKMMQFVDMDSSKFQYMKNKSRKYILNNYNYLPIAQEFTNIMVNEVTRKLN
jgi:glycosyltransferase involved in cell wall biosynthesis